MADQLEPGGDIMKKKNKKEITKDTWQTNMEFRKFMKEFDDEIVDIIITDPPYPITIGGGGEWMNSTNFKGQATKDKIDLYKTMTDDDLHYFIQECFRVLKNNTHFFIMTNESNLSKTIKMAEDVGFDLKNKIIWVKCRDFNDGMAMGRYFLNGYEYMLLFAKGKIEPINNRMNVLVKPPITRGLNAKPKELWAHCISGIAKKDHLIIDPFAGSDPLSRCKMHRLIQGKTISNVFITTEGNDPGKWGQELRSTLFNWGGLNGQN